MIHPKAAERLNKPEMSNANILVDINNALQRLESSLDDQHVRIRTIEGFIRSNRGSPTYGQFSSIATSMIEETYQIFLDLPKLHRFPRRFEFIDDSCSDLGHNEGSEKWREENVSGTIGPPQSPMGSIETHRLSAQWKNNGKCVGALDNSDAYSQSIYSSRPLSRLELDIPPVPPIPEEFGPPSGRYSLYDTPPLPVNIPTVRKPVSIRAYIGSFSGSVSGLRYRRSWGGVRSKVAASVTSAESSGRQSHQRAGMSFHAYTNLKSSVHSSILFRSRERVARREERSRLEGLSPVSGSGVGLRSMLCEKVEFEGKGTLAMLHSLLGRLRDSSVKFYRAKRSLVTGNGFA